MSPDFGPELRELLVDPLTHCMLAADGIDQASLSDLLERARNAIKARQASASGLGRELVAGLEPA